VDQAVVVVQRDGSWAGLVGYVTGPAAGAEEPAEILRDFLGERLPEYMVPAHFVGLEALPLTPTGKVDRRALPVPEDLRSGGREYVAPSTEIEEVLAEHWQEILGLEKVGTKDNFFDLGGHSLLATQLVSRVRESFDVEITFRQFFEGPTVAQLAEEIETLLIEQISSLGDEEAMALLEADDDWLGDA
jgi:acyl carrier protein